MYQLIGSPKSRAFRVLWALEELAQHYQLSAVGPHSPEIKALNPSGKIPALIDGDNTITDSVAIVQYLADKHGKLSHRAGTIERARQDSFTQFACDDMDGNLWNTAKHRFVLPEELRLADAKMANQWDFARAMNTLEQRLGSNRYIMGDQFTVPDIIITHCANWAQMSGFEIAGDSLNSYLQRVRERPAYEKTMQIRNTA